MGHQIEYYTYEENVNKGMVENDLNNYVSQATWQEGGSGLCQSIKWKNHICDTYEDAREWISEHDGGWYDQLAVKFKSPVQYSKKYKEIEKSLSEASKKRTELNTKIHYKDVKSSFVSCKCCGSKLATKYISSNKCPLCRTDLRPESTLKQIEKAKEKCDELYKKLQAEKKKQKSEICWLVKIEYHV